MRWASPSVSVRVEHRHARFRGLSAGVFGSRLGRGVLCACAGCVAAVRRAVLVAAGARASCRPDGAAERCEHDDDHRGQHDNASRRSARRPARGERRGGVGRATALVRIGGSRIARGVPRPPGQEPGGRRAAGRAGGLGRLAGAQLAAWRPARRARRGRARGEVARRRLAPPWDAGGWRARGAASGGSRPEPARRGTAAAGAATDRRMTGLQGGLGCGGACDRTAGAPTGRGRGLRRRLGCRRVPSGRLAGAAEPAAGSAGLRRDWRLAGRRRPELRLAWAAAGRAAGARPAGAATPWRSWHWGGATPGAPGAAAAGAAAGG